MREYLDILEQMTMVAAKLLGDNACMVSIVVKIKELTGLSIHESSVYAILVRLEKHGFIITWHGDHTLVRGGRAKRIVRVTKAGERRLENSLLVTVKMLKAMDKY